MEEQTTKNTSGAEEKAQVKPSAEKPRTKQPADQTRAKQSEEKMQAKQPSDQSPDQSAADQTPARRPAEQVRKVHEDLKKKSQAQAARSGAKKEETGDQSPKKENNAKAAHPGRAEETGGKKTDRAPEETAPPYDPYEGGEERYDIRKEMGHASHLASYYEDDDVDYQDTDPYYDPSYDYDDRYEEFAMWQYLIYMILFGIPFFGIIYSLVVSIGSRNPVLKKFATAFFLFSLIWTLVLAIVVAVGGLAGVASLFVK